MIELNVGDNSAILGDSPADGKIYWEFIAIAEVSVATSDVIPVEPETALGDVNGDGEIDAVDYAMVKRAVLGTFDLTEEQMKFADIDNDGEITAIDYAMIKRHVLGTYVIEG